MFRQTPDKKKLLSQILIGIVATTLTINFVAAQSPNEAQVGSVQSSQDQTIDWTQWRGPNRDGKAIGNWPDSVSESVLAKKWSVPMGPSYSGPIVVGDMVFVTETKDRKYEVTKALDRATGKEIWSTQWLGAMSVPFFAKSNGDWIRSTPTYDDGKLYVCGMKDVMVCLNAKDGKEIWKVDFTKRFNSPVPSFGMVCSPVIDGDDLYVQAGGGFCKLDKKTGETIWRVLADGGGMNGSAFSSPTIATLAGKKQIVIQGREALTSVDMESGTTLWSTNVATFRGMNILTPTVFNDSVFLSTYGGTTQRLDITKEGSSFAVSKRWELGKQGYMSTPVVVDGHAYLNMKNKTLACFDLESGKLKWSSPRYGQYASLVTNGKKILALDESGKLLLFNANPEKFDLLDTRTVSNDTWAHLGVRKNELFVRELDKMTMYEWKQ